MTTQTEALKLALEALELCNGSATVEGVVIYTDLEISAIKEALAQPEQEPDYAWPTVEDYENDVGFSVNDAFKMGWSMARTTNDLFTQMMEQS